MTSFHRLSAPKVIALGAALSMTAGLALAGDNNVSADQILNALQPKQ
jgi:Na+(H+)/acetate symporter ActP